MKRRMMDGMVALMCAIFCAACATSGIAPKASSTATLPPIATRGVQYPVGGEAQLVASDGAIWILDSGNTGTLNRFDPDSKAIVASISVGLESQPGRGEIAFNDFALWLSYTADGTLTKIDPHRDVIVAKFHLSPGQLGPTAVSPEAVWTANKDANSVTRIDSATGAVVATIPVPKTPTSVAYGADSVWVCSQNGGTMGLTRIDPVTNRIVAQIDVGASAGYQCDWVQFSSQTGALWIVALDTQTQREDIIERIDTATNQVRATIHLQDNIQTSLAIGATDVWACNETTLYRVDAQSAHVKGSLPLGAFACSGMLMSSASLWIAHGAGGTLESILPAP
jgi:YVTN family beta-propeller protein